MKKEHIIEIVVWILLIVTIGGATFGIQSYKYIHRNTYTLTFQDIDGIIKGSPVRFSGVIVGHVRNIKVCKDCIEVQIIITKPGLKIPDGTIARVEFSGLAGSKSIEMGPSENSYKRGIVAQNPIRIGDFLDSLQIYSNVLMGLENGLVKLSSENTMSIIKKLKEPVNFESINRGLDSAARIEQSTHGVLQKITRGEEIIMDLIEKLPQPKEKTN